ncbi:hypothetical protein GCM10009639_26920 [Kitasatospora putterlickiae]|uniref:Uncharacterized protein n=1 Tax=Kitasatospora putterlickiae TaxID=221725 RepID=A0ABP4ISG6_9ACTN
MLIDGQEFQDFSFDITGKTRAAPGCVGRRFAFVAQGTSTTLSFASTVAGAYGPVLDNVQVRGEGVEALARVSGPGRRVVRELCGVAVRRKVIAC